MALYNVHTVNKKNHLVYKIITKWQYVSLWFYVLFSFAHSPSLSFTLIVFALNFIHTNDIAAIRMARSVVQEIFNCF